MDDGHDPILNFSNLMLFLSSFLHLVRQHLEILLPLEGQFRTVAFSQQLAQDLVQVSLYWLPKLAGSADLAGEGLQAAPNLLARLTGSAQVVGEIAGTDGLSVEGPSVSELSVFR